MYLSRIYICNFRSIKQLDLPLRPGKNVIVGRNNIGKSNIVRALDLVLGDSNPSYQKSENIVDNDFYSWRETTVEGTIIEHVSDDIFIWCELTRPADEPLNYDELYKAFGFYIYSSIVDWRNKRPIKEPIRIPARDLPSNYASLFALTEEGNNEKDYVNTKFRSQQVLERALEDKYLFAFAFRATKDDQGKIEKDI